MIINSAKELKVYKAAYDLSMEIFENEDHDRLTVECKQVGAMLGKMLNNPTPFLIKPS